MMKLSLPSTRLRHIGSLLLVLCCTLSATPMQAQRRTVLSSKLDARAALAVGRQTDGQASETFVPIYLTLSDSTAKARLSRQYQIHFNVQCGNIHTVIVPLSHLSELTKEAAIVRIDMGEQLRPLTDQVRQKTMTDLLHAGTDLPTSYRGRGVLIGIIDTGFDFTHPNFMDAAQQVRILKVWDQNAITAPNSSYGYGTCYNTPEQITAARHDNAMTTHGTHVAGITAGSADTPYKGMAPESELLLVSTNRSEQGIVDAVDYLLRCAQAANRPLVINVSLGTMMGFKDGTGTMARMVDALLKDRKGCLMAVAVGNEGHRRSTLRGREVGSIWKIPASGSDQLFVEARPKEHCTLRLTLRNKRTAEVLFDKTFETGRVWTEKYDQFGTDDKARALLTAQCLRNEATDAFALSIHVGYTLATDEEWKVELRSAFGSAAAYCNNGYFSAEGHADLTDGTTESSIAMTATGREPIAVGATVSRNQYTALSGVTTTKPWTLGRRYPLSALGPTSDGRIKPDITAPGAAVVSSYNSFAAPRTVKADDVVYRREAGGKPYYWYVESGTSMATPAVSGILALWLQACPTLTADRVRELLSTTAQRPTFMGQTPNNEYGRGEIDAAAGLRQLLQTSGIASLAAAPDYVLDPATRTLTTTGTKTIGIYDPDGRRLMHTTQAQVDLSTLPRGLYLIKMTGRSGTKVIKVCL